MFFELGWSIKTGKPCLIFMRDEKDLPFVLRKIVKSKKIQIELIPYQKDDEILQYLKMIKNRNHDIFGATNT